jgi:hypothetical protein
MINPTIVITSISCLNYILNSWAKTAHLNKHNFIIVGDIKTPDELGSIENCDYYNIDRQLKTGLHTADLCLKNHYSRKNIGYLLAIQKGAKTIIETDDDNLFYPNFWEERYLSQTVKVIDKPGWVNIYKYFTNDEIWPRGFPLSRIKAEISSFDSLPTISIDCPIQQGLANGDPDVDAIYRLTRPIIKEFQFKRKIAITKFSFCPFNSQNTIWWDIAFPLLYLPSFCSFRMTDIWRSFIAQIIAMQNQWGVLFSEPTVYQLRNEHDLMKDFNDEIPGYLNNEKIVDELIILNIKAGREYLGENLYICYEKLVSLKIVAEKELILLEGWLNDLKQLS